MPHAWLQSGCLQVRTAPQTKEREKDKDKDKEKEKAKEKTKEKEKSKPKDQAGPANLQRLRVQSPMHNQSAGSVLFSYTASLRSQCTDCLDKI